MEGPFRAPSSPPDTPQPTYSSPLLSTYLVRRMVSGKWLLPPSTRMSADWNRTELDSYLIEITRDILGYQDEKGA